MASARADDAEQRVDLVGREVTGLDEAATTRSLHELDLVGECNIEQVSGPLILGRHGSNLDRPAAPWREAPNETEGCGAPLR